LIQETGRNATILKYTHSEENKTDNAFCLGMAFGGCGVVFHIRRFYLYVFDISNVK
jgi:hypothetical protein